MKDDLYNAVINGEVNSESKITVDIIGGPLGNCGFRSGLWPISIGVVKFSMRASIPHQMALIEQEKMLIEMVESRLKNAIDAETYDAGDGTRKLRYVSQMTRK